MRRGKVLAQVVESTLIVWEDLGLECGIWNVDLCWLCISSNGMWGKSPF